MRGTTAIEKASRLVAEGRHDEALEIVFRLMNGSRADPRRPEVVALLAQVAHTDPSAMINFGQALMYGDGCPADPIEALRWMKKGLAGVTGEEAIHARTLIGELLLGILPGSAPIADVPAGLALLERAATDGSGTAAFNAGQVYHYAKGVPADHAKAARLYRVAIASDRNPLAMHNLAGMILLGIAEGRAEEALAFYEGAAMAGDMKSRQMLGILEPFRRGPRGFDLAGARAMLKKADAGPAPGGGTVMPRGSERLVPSNAARVEGISTALQNALGIDGHSARSIVAALHGVQDWHEMVQSAGRDPACVPDEKLAGPDLARRRAWQAEVLTLNMGMPPFVATRVIEHLRPTSGEGTPSLRGFVDEAEAVAAAEPPSLEELLAFAQDRLGMDLSGMMDMDGDDDAPDPEGEIDALAEALRSVDWDVEAVEVEDERLPALFAWSEKGQRFDVRLTRAEWPPGSLGGEDLAPQRAAIQRCGVPAVLIQTVPWVWKPRGTAALIYGGLLYDGAAWSEFCLAPGGLDAALEQLGTFDGVPTADFAKRWQDRDALVTVALMLGIDADYDDGDLNTFAELRRKPHASGWVRCGADSSW